MASAFRRFVKMRSQCLVGRLAPLLMFKRMLQLVLLLKLGRGRAKGPEEIGIQVLQATEMVEFNLVKNWDSYFLKTLHDG